ncbi:hypothetical protein SUDANB57_00017 [Streptomyces sp. enrichment culture]
MGGNQARAFVGGEPPHEPVHGPVVEVVRRLVEQQPGRFVEDQGGQGEAGPLPSREAVHSAGPVEAGQAEDVQDLTDAGAELPAAATAELLLEAAVFGQYGREVAGFGRHALLRGAHSRGQLPELGRGPLQYVFDGEVVGGELGLLRQEPDAAGDRAHDLAVLRCEVTGEDTQQGGLAAAVLADQTDPLAVGDGERHIAQHRAVSQSAVQVLGEEVCRAPVGGQDVLPAGRLRGGVSHRWAPPSRAGGRRPSAASGSPRSP